MFMDDLVSGNKNVSSGIAQIRHVNNIFKSGGMHMRKWTSNIDEVLKEIPPEDRQTAPIDFGQAEFVKVLGIQWFPSTDCFGFKVRLPPAETTTTKRKFFVTCQQAIRSIRISGTLYNNSQNIVSTALGIEAELGRSVARKYTQALGQVS